MSSLDTASNKELSSHKSSESNIMTVSDMIDKALGTDPDENTVDFKLLQIILHILALQLKILDRKILVRLGYLPNAGSLANISITQLKLLASEARKGKKKSSESIDSLQKYKDKKKHEAGKEESFLLEEGEATESTLQQDGKARGRKARKKGGTGSKREGLSEGSLQGSLDGEDGSSKRRARSKSVREGESEQDMRGSIRTKGTSTKTGSTLSHPSEESIEYIDADGTDASSKKRARSKSTKSQASSARSKSDREPKDQYDEDGDDIAMSGEGGSQKGTVRKKRGSREEDLDSESKHGAAGKGGKDTQQDTLLVVEKLAPGEAKSGAQGTKRQPGTRSMVTLEEFQKLESEVQELYQRLTGTGFPGYEKLMKDLRKGASMADPMAAVQMAARLDSAESVLQNMMQLMAEIANSFPGGQSALAGALGGLGGVQSGMPGAFGGLAGPQGALGAAGVPGGQFGAQGGLFGAQGGLAGTQGGIGGAQFGLTGAQGGLSGAQGGLGGAQGGLVGSQGGLGGAQSGPGGAQGGLGGAQGGLGGAQGGLAGIQGGLAGTGGLAGAGGLIGAQGGLLGAYGAPGALGTSAEAQAALAAQMGGFGAGAGMPGAQPYGLTAAGGAMYGMDPSTMTPEQLAAMGIQTQKARKSQPDFLSGLTGKPDQNISPKDLTSTMKRLEDDLMKNFNNLNSRVTDNINVANSNAAENESKIEDVLGINSLLEELSKRITSFSERINKLDSEYSANLTVFQDTLTQMQYDLEVGLDAMMEALANTAGDPVAVAELNSKFTLLQSDFDTIINSQRTLNQDELRLDYDLKLMLSGVNVLTEVKCDRDEVEEALKDKAGISDLNGLVTLQQFDSVRGDLEKKIGASYDTFNSREIVWQKSIDDLNRELGDRADKVQVVALQDDVQKNVDHICSKIRYLSDIVGEPRVPTGERRLYRDIPCISCSSPAHLDEMRKSEMTVLSEKRPPTIGSEAKPEYPKEDSDHNICFAGWKIPHEPLPRAQICRRYCGGRHTVSTKLPETPANITVSSLHREKISDGAPIRKLCIPCNIPKLRRVSELPAHSPKSEDVTEIPVDSDVPVDIDVPADSDVPVDFDVALNVNVPVEFELLEDFNVPVDSVVPEETNEATAVIEPISDMPMGD